MRYDAEHKRKTRQKVLTEAAKAIRAEGPHRVAVAGIMARAGLTHGGFYAHFASKEALVAAAIGEMFDEGRARLLKATDGRPPAEGLTAYVDFYLSEGHRDTRTSGCPLPVLSADMPRLAQDARAAFAAGASRLTAVFAQTLRALGRDDAQVLASSAIAELVGALALARAEPDADRSTAILERSREAVKRRLGLPLKA